MKKYKPVRAYVVDSRLIVPITLHKVPLIRSLNHLIQRLTDIIKNRGQLVGQLGENKLCTRVEVAPAELERTLATYLEP